MAIETYESLIKSHVGLLAYYRFSESGSTVLDSSGNDNHGTLSGSYTPAPSKLVGDPDPSMRFDLGKVTLANEIILNGDFTLTFLLQVDNSSKWNTWGVCSAGDFSHDINFFGTALTFWNGSYNVFMGTLSDETISDHWVITRIGTDVRAYKNGSLDVSGGWGGQFRIKYLATSLVNVGMNGSMDEFAVLSQGLSAEQAAALYTQSQTAPPLASRASSPDFPGMGFGLLGD